MKQVLVLLLCFLLITKGQAQILKKIGNRIKNDAAWRVSNKVDNEVRKGVDSLFEAPKKIKDKKKDKKNNGETATQSPGNTANTTGNTNSTGNINAEVQDGNGVTQKDGFITLELSANTIFTGGYLQISGQSILYKDYKQVEIKVTGPSATDTRNIPLNADGNYFAEWIASEKTGDYTVTVIGSDKKSKQSATFTVAEIDIIFADDWPEENIKQTKKALDNLEEAVDNAEAGLSTKDKEAMENKMDELRKKTAEVLDFFKELNTAGKEISKLARSGKKMSSTLAGNLSQLNRNLNEQASQMKKISEVTDHKSADNTICEYLVMVNEACAAFSAITSIWGKAALTILKNMIANKDAPKTGEAMNTSRVPPGVMFMGKETGKIYIKSYIKAEAVTSKLNTVGFAGDIAQFATDVLMKRYCGVFKGSLTHDYNIQFRNSDGQNWWTYGVETKAALFLRYPKEKDNGKIIKMKGNLEGNATKFTFFQDVEKVEDLRKLNKSMYKMQVVPIRTLTPLAVSVATSERDIMGFGAIARGMATPAYFNFLVDAEYDVDAGKIKLFITKPIIDFSPAVANQFIFLMIGPDGLPYIRHMIFPIHKVNLTLGSLIKINHEFTVDKDSKSNLSFKGKGNRHIGDKSTERETDLNFTISATKE